MEHQGDGQRNGLITYWVGNLVGSAPSLLFNIVLALIGGGLYSFGAIDSPLMLLFFGVITPLIYTLCLYTLIRSIARSHPNHPIIGPLGASPRGVMLMLLDMLLVVALAALIHLGLLNYLIFRLLQTMILPIAMLILLRILFLGTQDGAGGDPPHEG